MFARPGSQSHQTNPRPRVLFVTYATGADFLRPYDALPKINSLRSSWTHQVQRGGTAPERRFGRLIVFDTPVLVVNAVVLRDVEPHQPERAIVAHSGEQVRDLPGLISFGTHRDLGQQHRSTGKGPYFGDSLAEDAEEGLRRIIVITVDPDPGDVLLAGPPRSDRTSTPLIRLKCPQPGDVSRVPSPEHGHDVPPSGHECGR